MVQTIETIMTKCSNPTVYCPNFANLSLSKEEPMQDVIVQLKFIAQDCQYSCCSCQAELKSIHAKDQFLQGLNTKILQTFVPRLNISNLSMRLLKMLKLLNQHFEIMPTHINKQILPSESVQIKS